MEWLNHSNKSTKQCDICNTPYRFRTIYDPNMPKTMPLKDVWNKLMQSLGGWLLKNVSIVLYAVCALQVPIFWKFVGRIFTYTVDGKLPSPQFNMIHALLYGAYNVRSRTGHLLTGPDATPYDKLEYFFFNTFVSGVIYVVVFVFVLVVVFIEHEWVVREEGYTKLLLRQIGKEPRTKLADLLKLLLRGDVENDAAREIMINRALEDLQHIPDFHRNEAELRRVLAERISDLERPLDPAPVVEPAEDTHAMAVRPPPFYGQDTAENVDTTDGANRGEDPHAHLHGEAHGEHHHGNAHEEHPHGNAHPNQGHPHENPHPHQEHPHENPHPQNIHRPLPEATHHDDDSDAEDNTINLIHDDDDEDETAEELERRQNLAEDELAAAEAANNNGDLLEIFGIRFNLVTPIQLMMIADFAVVLFLFNAYLIPHMIGSFAVMAVSYVVKDVLTYHLKPVIYVLPISLAVNAFVWVVDKSRENAVLDAVYFITSKIIVTPVLEFAKDVFSSQRTKPPTTTERIFLLFVGYGIICTAVHRFMTALVSGRKPVLGTSRKIYKFLFKIVATAKVFAIFTIEIILFPIFCGFLLDFCVQPILSSDLVTTVDSQTQYHLLFTSTVLILQRLYIRAIMYWLWGTFYMFFIALYVGMIRNSIFRPGVLFFIKSPEDPNARLIHDAVVKPFLLQLLRIFMSAKVYTAFIVLGIGGVTWGLRLFISPPSSETPVLLPIRFQGFLNIIPIWITAMLVLKAKPIIAKFCQIFWKRSFIVLCYKLRLSHFLLGTPIPQERGYVVYRNFIQNALKVSEPNYAEPLTYADAMQKFQDDPSVNACFIPDGNFIRVPGSDDNSHRFLRSLFVPVSKTDQLLKPAEEVPVDEEADWWDEDIEYEDTYSVVYSPPNLKSRCVILVITVCVFGALLIITLGIFALILGRPVYRAAAIVANSLLRYFNPEAEELLNINWALIDVNSLAIGIILELLGAVYVNYKVDEDGTRAFVVEQRERIRLPVQNARQVLKNILVSILANTVPYWVALYMHFGVLVSLEKYLFGFSLLGDYNEFRFNFYWTGLVMHLALLPWSVLPAYSGTFSNIIDPATSMLVLRRKAIDAIGCCGFIGLLRLYHIVAEYCGVEIGANDDIKMKMMALSMIILTRTAFGAYSLFTKLHEQIKNEKYIRGTAVENLMGADEDD